MAVDQPQIRRTQSRSFVGEGGDVVPIEFIIASDASAIIEHTKRVLYLEDDDVAHISEGGNLIGLHITHICVLSHESISICRFAHSSHAP